MVLTAAGGRQLAPVGARTMLALCVALAIAGGASAPAAADRPRAAGKEAFPDTLLARDLATRVFPVFGERGYGAGFLCDDAGLILTDIRTADGAAAPRVWISLEGSVAARVLARSPALGIAVLGVNPAQLAGRAALPLARPASSSLTVGPVAPLAHPGDRIVAIAASPRGRISLMRGMVRGVGTRRLAVCLAPRTGAVGAPLVNAGGQVIGILRSIGADSSSTSAAVPITEALQLVTAARESLRTGPLPNAELLPFLPGESESASAFKPIDQLADYRIELPGYVVSLLTPPVCASLEAHDPARSREWFLWGALERRYPSVVAVHVEPRKSTPSFLWPIAAVARVGRGTARMFGSVAGAVADGITGKGTERAEASRRRTYSCDLELLRNGVPVEPLVRQCSDHAYDKKKSVFVTRKGCKSAFLYYSRKVFEPADGQWPDIELRVFDPSKSDEPVTLRLTKRTLELVAADLGPISDRGASAR